MKHIFFVLSMFMALTVYSQVGYQVSLLDTKTGEPRANEKVSVTVIITDSKGTVICNEQKTVTSDSFGVLSMTIGNADTFSNVDWRNLPLKISASVDGILLGSSHIITVPVAEYAKQTGVLTPELLSTLTYRGSISNLAFSKNGIATLYYEGANPNTQDCPFEIDGNNVYIYYTDENNCAEVFALHYNVRTGKFYRTH